MNRKIEQIESIEEFKEYGKKHGGFKRIKSIIRNELFINSNTFTCWEGLYKFIKIFNKSYMKVDNHCNFDDDFFKSLSAKYIYALVELDTEKRADILKITSEHYRKLSLAKKWKRNIAKEIHPDKCCHPRATEAMAKLNDLYKSMVKYGE